MEMILAKIQVRYRLNDDLFIDKGIIPYKKKKQEKRTLVHRLTNCPNTRKNFRMIMENENKGDIVIYQTK